MKAQFKSELVVKPIINCWKSFLNSLDSPGAHILILVLLFNEGIMFYHYFDPTGGGQVMNLSFGALMGYLAAKKLEDNNSGPTSSLKQ